LSKKIFSIHARKNIGWKMSFYLFIAISFDCNIVCKNIVCKNIVCKNIVCKNIVCKNIECINIVCKNIVCKNIVCKNIECINIVCKNIVCKNIVCKNIVFKNIVCDAGPIENKKTRRLWFSYFIFSNVCNFSTSCLNYLFLILPRTDLIREKNNFTKMNPIL